MIFDLASYETSFLSVKTDEFDEIHINTNTSTDSSSDVEFIFTTSTDSSSSDEDDDLTAECANLAMAEELVRKELAREIAIDSRTGEVVESPYEPFEAPRVSYTLRVHYESLKLSKSLDAVYVCDMSEHFFNCNMELKNVVQEYCQPPPFETLASLFVGMKGAAKLTKNKECPSYEHALPVRTLTMRIRPDARCASVLDAVRVAVESSFQHRGFLMKSQGGHLRAAVASQNASYMFDAQLCTVRANSRERRLVLRFYHVNDEVTSELGISNAVLPEGTLSEAKIPSILHLKEASALIQLLKAKKNGWRATKDLALDSSFPSKALLECNVSDQASAYLQTTSWESASVIKRLRCKALNMPTAYPSLSPHDWPLIAASSVLCSEIWWGLEKTCAYNSLTTTNPFGQAPFLPTLDIHYCAHLEILSKERLHPDFDKAMIELDERVERAEETNSLFMDVTKTMCETYKITQIKLTDIAVEVYDATKEGVVPESKFKYLGELVPESKSEYLGELALQALKGLFEADPADSDGFHLSIADRAVSAVHQAIVDQHDNERREQLKRRNGEVTSRLLQLRYQTIETYSSLTDSFHHSEEARAEKEEIFELVKTAAKRDKSILPQWLDTVPLVRIPINQGMCYVTASHIIFRTQSYFRPQTLFFSLDNTKLQPSSSNSMGVFVKNKKVFTFRPSMDVNRLKKFMSILQPLQQAED
jgi:hypothetical protein